MNHPKRLPVLPLHGYGMAGLCVLMAVGLKWKLEPVLGIRSPFLLSFTAVLISAWYGGRGPGLLATFLSAAIVYKWTLSPSSLFLTRGGHPWIGVCLFSAEGVLISALVGQLRWALQKVGESEARNRKKAQELDVLYTSCPAGLGSVDTSLRFLRINDALARMNGASPQSIVGRTLHEVVPALAGRLEPLYRQVFATGQPLLNLELKGTTLESPQRERSFLVSYYPLTNETGTVVAVNSVVQDITERQAARSALRESEERLVMALEVAEMIAWDWDLVRGKVFRSANACRVLGIKEEVAVAEEDFSRLIHPQDRPGVQAAVQQALEEDRPYRAEFRLLSPGGGVIWVDDRAKITRDECGRPIRMTGIYRNITELKKVTQAVLESEERYRTLANTIPQLLWTARPDGECDYISNQWLEYTGQAMENCRSYAWWGLLHPEDVERTHRHWRECLRSGAHYSIQYRLRRFDGQYRWFQTRALPILNDQGQITHWLGTCTDIEEQIQAQEAIGQLNAALEERVEERTAQLRATIQELEAFSYSVSHDLRAPLRAMQNYAQILLEDVGPSLNALATEYLQRIVDSGARLDKLIQDVLTFSRMARQPIESEAVDLDRLLRQVLEHYPGLQPPQALITIEEGLEKVIGHEASLVQCLSNLLGNAVKFVAPGIVPQVRVRNERLGDQVRVWVEDNGIGIAREEQGRLFRMFERVHDSKAYEGTGIGLAIVCKAMERMHGSMGVESELGQGSRFWIQLKRFQP